MHDKDLRHFLAPRRRLIVAAALASVLLAVVVGLLVAVPEAEPSPRPGTAAVLPIGEGRGTTTTTLPLIPPQEASRLQAAHHQNLRLAAEALTDISVFDEPNATEPRLVLPALGTFGTPNAFLVTAEAVGNDDSLLYEVYLPQKPNESRGWVPAEQLDVFPVETSIVVRVGERRLDLYQRGRLLQSFSVAVGKDATPTPRGKYFVTVQLETPNLAGAYGPLALGLNAYSEVLTWWAGGGQSAIHGTNAPGSVGKAASNGCIRMSNADILTLGALAPVGTPVEIVD